MEVNRDRIWQRIQLLGKIGENKNKGVSRFPFTFEDNEATNLVIKWMGEAGLSVRKDAVGNVIGRREGKTSAPVIMAGSHLDTVTNGGKFDGVVGVISVLEAIEIMQENKIITEFPIEIIIFVNEEGSRFPGGLMGSMAIVGKLPLDFPYTIRDEKGILLADEMKKWGFKPDSIFKAIRKEGIKAFFELHIEQGRVLEESNKPIGIVSKIAGLYQARLSIIGQCGHAGAITMKDRKDPMVAAGIIIQKIEDIAKNSRSGTRGTVGYIKSFPGGDNVIPEKVELSIDFRYIDKLEQEEIDTYLKDFIKDICEERELEYQLVTTQRVDPVFVDSKVISLMEKAAKNCFIPYDLLSSWTAHDAMVMGNICLIGMIFIRSYKGLSHCPQEYSSPEDIAQGAEILFHTLKTTANNYLS